MNRQINPALTYRNTLTLLQACEGLRRHDALGHAWTMACSDRGATLDPTSPVDQILARYSDLCDERIARVRRAAEMGAGEDVLTELCDAARTSTEDTIVLDAHRYEHLSRGRGWARQGRGKNAVWGERVKGGYRVGPGEWTVGATDGYGRDGKVEWAVRHVQVGVEVWTVAS